MAYWFHRNPLKATALLTFEIRGVTSTEQTRKILSTLRSSRSKILELIADPNHEVHTIETSVSEYVPLIQGMYHVFEDSTQQNVQDSHPAESAEQTSQKKSEGNKLRSAFKYKWTNTLLGTGVTEMYDVVFEHFSMMFNVALWYSKHAAKMAAKENCTMEEAKEVHSCLRTAAGILTCIKNELVPKIHETIENASDADSRVLDAYINQCTAEAQEVTMARAMELKHKASLIAALSFETGQLYVKADDALASLDAKIVGKWRKYLQLKSQFYFSYAHSYHGEALLGEDKCGEAIRCLQESVKMYEKAGELCREYASTKGVGTNARPQDHFFYRKLGPHVKRTLEKCERENGMIYHEKVPYDPPQIDLKATYGLASPIEYETPSLSPLWTIEVYKKFDLKLHPKPEPKPEKAENLANVKEKEYPMNDKDPKNVSGCEIS